MSFIIINILFKSNNIIATISIKSLTNCIPIKVISAGQLGFKNTQKKTPLACLTILNYIKNFLLQKFNNFNIYLNLKGIHFFKNLIFKTFFNTKLFKIINIKENYIIAYNGCKIYNNIIYN